MLVFVSNLPVCTHLDVTGGLGAGKVKAPIADCAGDSHDHKTVPPARRHCQAAGRHGGALNSESTLRAG